MTAVITLDGRSGSRPLSYCTPENRYRIVVSTPTAEPELWREYLAGAQRRYAEYDVAGVLDIDRVRDGGSTSLFFAAFSLEGEVIGGMRSQGPYTSADQAHDLAVWDRDPARPRVHSMISDRLPDGVVESRSAWVARGFPGRRELVGCLSRGPLHASAILGARWALGTSAAHTLPMWTSTGAVVAGGLGAIGYPDDRYRTELLWWDRWALPETVSESVKRALDAETAQLLSPVVPAGG